MNVEISTLSTEVGCSHVLMMAGGSLMEDNACWNLSDSTYAAAVLSTVEWQ
jgi:hypothetical protein